MTTSPCIVFVIGLALQAATSDKLLPTSQFWEPFDQRPSYRVILGMPEEEQKAYFPLSREESVQACREVLWSATAGLYDDAAKAFIAATPYPDVQRRFAGRISALCPAYLGFWVAYYDHDEEKFIDWALSMNEEIQAFTYQGGRNVSLPGWLTVFVLLAPPEIPENAAERAFWSILAGRKVEESELQKARNDPELIREFWMRFKGLDRDRLFWLFLGGSAPTSVLESVFIKADEGWRSYLQMDDRVYIDAWISPEVFDASPEEFFWEKCRRYYEEKWKTDDESILREAVRESGWGKGSEKKGNGEP